MSAMQAYCKPWRSVKREKICQAKQHPGNNLPPECHAQAENAAAILNSSAVLKLQGKDGIYFCLPPDTLDSQAKEIALTLAAKGLTTVILTSDGAVNNSSQNIAELRVGQKNLYAISLLESNSEVASIVRESSERHINNLRPLARDDAQRALLAFFTERAKRSTHAKN